MNLLYEKTKEVARTLFPVMVLVLLICFTIVDVESDIMTRFLVGSVLLLIGLSVFLWGVDLAMVPIGDNMSKEVATSKTPIKIAILSFFLGFLITVAEPDLLILGTQIQSASGGALSSTIIVYLVSIGVGVMITFGVFRLLFDKPLNIFMTITYGIILILAIFVSQEFVAISFDASGATTGALTTPFVLALSLGLSNIKGGKHTSENSFGLVGIMSAGPILAVISMSLITGQKNIQGDASEYIPAEGVIGPILDTFPHIFKESLIALIPITVLFFIFNFAKFKLAFSELRVIIRGLITILLGLTLFLTAVNSGFMDMGRIIGMELAAKSNWLLIGIAFVLGLIVVLVEPAVHVLGEQIEEATGGHIPIKLIRMTLSIGVGTAIALSMVRIVVPQVQLWYFLLPGFALAVILSFISDPAFVGIAYDAGGVASGPMTATFVLAFAQGAATMIDTADVLVDGFGVIAMVAMAPVVSIMVLGTLLRHKEFVGADIKSKKSKAKYYKEDAGLLHNCIMVVVNKGFADRAIGLARRYGATGATIIHGRGEGVYRQLLLPILHLEVQPEKEIILFITSVNLSAGIANGLLRDNQLNEEGEIVVFVSPTEAMVETLTSNKSREVEE